MVLLKLGQSQQLYILKATSEKIKRFLQDRLRQVGWTEEDIVRHQGDMTRRVHHLKQERSQHTAPPRSAAPRHTLPPPQRPLTPPRPSTAPQRSSTPRPSSDVPPPAPPPPPPAPRDREDRQRSPVQGLRRIRGKGSGRGGDEREQRPWRKGSGRGGDEWQQWQWSRGHGR